MHSSLTPPFSFGSDSCTPVLIVKCTTEAVQVDWHPKLSSISPPKGPNLTPERYRETVRDISLTLGGHISGFFPAYALQGETPKWDEEFWGQRQIGQQTHCSFLKDLSSDLLGDFCPQSRALPSSPPLASYNNILCFSCWWLSKRLLPGLMRNSWFFQFGCVFIILYGMKETKKEKPRPLVPGQYQPRMANVWQWLSNIFGLEFSLWFYFT